MSKKFKGVPCVYCMKNKASTGDHVVARSFFLKDQRDNLPTVPACAACNNVKSRLEHLLSAVLPFGAQHSKAQDALKAVEAKLAKNRKLLTLLSRGFRDRWRSVDRGPWERSITVPLNTEDLMSLCKLIIKGLYSYHWKVALSPECTVYASYLAQQPSTRFDAYLDTAPDRITSNLGDGVFTYEVARLANHPEITVWRMSFYGAQVGGDKDAPWVRPTQIYGCTHPRNSPATAELFRLFTG